MNLSKNQVLGALFLVILTACPSQVTETDGGTPAQASISRIEIRPGQLELDVGDAIQLSVVAIDSDNEETDFNDAIDWSVSDSEIIAVQESSMLAALAPGEATVTAKVGLLTTSVDVTVNPLDDDAWQLAIRPENLFLAVTESVQLSVALVHNNGDEEPYDAVFTWSVDDSELATVSDMGVLTGLSLGTVVVTAAFEKATLTSEIRIVPAEAPTFLGYVAESAYPTGQTIGELNPLTTGGAISNYAVVPSLPAGLYLSNATGVISGTPEAVTPSTLYTVTGENTHGSVTTTLEIEIYCEPTTPPVQTDEPDENYQDSNGDGIDGMACGPVFVSPSGDDGNSGELASPKKTIAAALETALQTSPSRAVYVDRGTYDETLIISQAADLFGGFDSAEGWGRVDGVETIVNGGATAISIEGVDEEMTLGFLSVNSASASQGTEHSIGVRIQDSSGLVRLAHLKVVSRDGASGENADVVNPETVSGNPGANGDSGCEDDGIGCDSCSTPTPGYGGIPLLSGYGGGTGGLPGKDGNAGSNGQTGGYTSDPILAAAGGAGGQASVNDGRGGDGADGPDGLPGLNGLGGTSGRPGEHGEAGGTGGGGGGGGGGAGGDFLCNSYGGAGGGGGSGGVGGLGGRGGYAGSGSYGIVVKNSSVYVGYTQIQTGVGGNGGAGSAGTAGRPGGSASTTSGDETQQGGSGEDDSGRGGNGGNGGAGGQGGAGGGGGGGDSVGILVDDEQRVEIVGLDATWAVGGAGGQSDGNAGETGRAASFVVDSLPDLVP